MPKSKMLKRLLGKAEKRGPGYGSIDQYRFDGDRPNDDEVGVISDLFWNNTGPVVHKWHHYLPLYERYFYPFRDRPIRMLEIGVSKGGSLQLWRKYFGPEATIFGIDIDPTCSQYDGESGSVRIGSQTDPDFLKSVVAEMGGLDLVLDDGSHDSEHIMTSLETLYPLLSNGGLYMIEDLHTAYWDTFSGGYAAPSSFMTKVKTMIDDLHHWYHAHGQKIAATSGCLGGIHIHDSIVVLDKQAVQVPRHTEVGG